MNQDRDEIERCERCRCPFLMRLPLLCATTKVQLGYKTFCPNCRALSDTIYDRPVS